MSKLNAEQTLAANHFNGPCIVTAVPGSGKTSTLTQRVVNLINRKIDPDNILCLTFTNKAANEMRERIDHKIGSISSKVWISTFHGFFLAILRKHGDLIGLSSNFSIYDDKDQTSLMEKIARMHDYDTSAPVISSIIKYANDSRENLVSLDDYTEISPEEKAIIEEYYTLIDQSNAIDFSGILYKTYNLLSKNKAICETLSKRFKYILGDEWQDTNIIQYEVIKMIASHSNIFIVADAAQSIFSWRGAKPENIQKIKKDFDNVTEIILPRNYRSTAKILKAAQNLIRNNYSSKDVTLIPEKGDGKEVVVTQYAHPDDESFAIANKIKNIKQQTNCNWDSFAILYRTNMLSKTPEIMLRKLGIPYKIHGGFSFFDRSEIKTSLAYLSFLCNEHDTIAFTRAIQTPKRQIGDSAIGKLERICQQQKISMLEACKKADLISAIPNAGKKNLSDFLKVVDRYKKMQTDGNRMSVLATGFLKDTGLYDYMVEESKQDQDFKKRVDNINELLLSIADYELQKPQAKLSDYLQSVEIMTTDTNNETDDTVALLTMHSAKGLEFPYVFIIGCEDGIIPHNNSIREGDISEERRLLYVGISRAQVQLEISHCSFRKVFYQNSGKSKESKPSRFLEEIFP